MGRKRKRTQQKSKAVASGVSSSPAPVSSLDVNATAHKSSQKVVYLNNKLTHDALLKLFLWLPIEDLISVQYVCVTWEAAAQDEYLWNGYTLDMDTMSHKELRSIIKKMPALRNIEGHAPNKFVQIILSNVRNLRKMNGLFEPSISSTQVKKMYRKYPELETITLSACADDFLQSVRIIKKSMQLKQLNCHTVSYNRWSCSCNFNYAFMLDILRDKENFPVLQSLRITEPSFVDTFGGAAVSFLRDIIANKKQWLSQSDVNFCERSPSISRAITYCQRLQDLDVHIITPDTCGSDNFLDITDLAYLVMMLRKGSCLDESLYDFIIIRRPWKYLRYFCFSFSNYKNNDVLGMVIANASNLTTLIYNDMCFNTDENQLEQIGCLLKLKVLDVFGLKSISEKGLRHMRNQNLEQLNVSSSNLTVPNPHTYIVTMLRSMKLLRVFTFSSDSFKLQFESREKIEEFIKISERR